MTVTALLPEDAPKEAPLPIAPGSAAAPGEAYKEGFGMPAYQVGYYVGSLSINPVLSRALIRLADM